MSKKLLFAIIASVVVGHAFADSKTITTQDYVDNQDDAIYEYVDDELANKQDLIPVDDYTPDGNAGNYVNTTLVTYNMDDGTIRGDSYGIATPEAFANVGWHELEPGQGLVGLLDFGEGDPNLENTVPSTAAVAEAFRYLQNQLPMGTAGNVVTYNASGQIGGSVATYNGSTTYNASTDASKIAVMSAVQRKMTCARYVQNAAQTPENCLLWNVPD